MFLANRRPRPMDVLVTAAWLLVLPLLVAPAAAQQKVTVLKGGTLIDGLGSPPVQRAVVVIEGDTITAVGGPTLTYPADATVVDCTGKFIVPGLVESHVHYEEWMGEAFLNNGVTSIFGLAVGGKFPPGVIKQKALSQKADARMPRLYLIGEGAPRLVASMSEAEVRESVRKYLEQKPDFAGIGTFTGKNRQAYQWAADEVHKAGLIVFGHTEDAVESARAGQDSVEHLWGFALSAMTPQEREDFEKGKYLNWGTFLASKTLSDQLIKELVGIGTAINPTLFFEWGSPGKLTKRQELETYQMYSDPRLMAYYPKNIADALILQIAPLRSFSAKYADLVLPDQVTPQDLEEYKTAFKISGEFLKRFVAAGGKIQAGTDSPSGGTPGLSLRHEMELLVEAGLTPMQAIQAGTLWSGEILSGPRAVKGRPRIGLIAKGAFADVLVVTANPLDDIANLGKIDRVMKGGQFVQLGYDPAYYSFTTKPRSVVMVSAPPALSAITPNTVTEGSEAFELTVEGAGFIASSAIQVNGVTVPTTFVNPRTLKTRVPARLVEKAEPSYKDAEGPPTQPGVIADRIIPVTVFTNGPEAGVSNKIYLRVRAKWLSEQR